LKKELSQHKADDSNKEIAKNVWFHPPQKKVAKIANADLFQLELSNSFSSLTHETTVGNDVDFNREKVIDNNLNRKVISSPVNKDQSSTLKRNSAATSNNVLTNDVNMFQQQNISADYPIKPVVKKRFNSQDKQKVCIVGDSHIKRLSTSVLQHRVNHKYVTKKYFDGATSKHIKHYVLPVLHENTPQEIIIHSGTNDIKPNITRPVELAKEIIEIGNVCKSFGVKVIAVSAILPSKEDGHQKIINEVNSMLKDFCDFNGFNFLSNKNITEDIVSSDKTHLNDIGSRVLEDNFISFCNRI